MRDVNLKDLEADATAVAAVARMADEAHEAEMIAAGAMLAAAVTAVGPMALRAIGTRAKTASSQHNCDVNCCHPEEVTWTKERAVCLSDDRAGPADRRTSGTGGVYEGVDLLVTSAGRLFQLTYDGSWTQWQNGTSHWSAERLDYATAEAAVRDGWTAVEDHMRRLAEALHRYTAGDATKAAAARRERAERLAAAAKLI